MLFTLRILRDRATERGSRTSNSSLLGTRGQIEWLVHSEAFDHRTCAPLDQAVMANRVGVIDVSIANDIVRTW